MATPKPVKKATKKPVKKAAPPAGAPAGKVAPVQPTHLSVTFKIVTPDQMRKIVFQLTRRKSSAGESWAVMFELNERTDTTQEFQLVIQLLVAIDKGENAKAAATAADGLDSDQHAQALIAGDVSKAAKAGEASIADAETEAVNVISARNT